MELVETFKTGISFGDTQELLSSCKGFYRFYKTTLVSLAASQKVKWSSIEGYWKEMNLLFDDIFEMLAESTNEPVLLCLVALIQRCSSAHLEIDLSSCRQVFEQGINIVNKSVLSLKKLIINRNEMFTVWVAGASALVSIASQRSYLWDSVCGFTCFPTNVPSTYFISHDLQISKLRRNLRLLLSKMEEPEHRRAIEGILLHVHAPRMWMD